MWPQITAQDVADELMLEIEAGSSGRPNKAMEIGNMERLTPLLLQIPGIKPDWLAKQLIQRLDDRIDPTDAIAAGLPSMVTQNVMGRLMAQQGGGDPSQQGGADNAPQQAQGPTQGAPAGAPQLPEPPMGG